MDRKLKQGGSALLQDPAVDLRFRVFLFLLALAIPMHVVQWLRPVLASGKHLYGLGDRWSSLILLPEPFQFLFAHAWLWVAAAILVSRRGGRAAIYFFFAAIYSQTLFYPYSTSNHWTLICFAVAICAVSPIPASAAPPGSQSCIRSLRILCAMTYGFAFIHKLNHAYLQPETSAVGPFAEMILQNIPGADGRALWLRFGTPFIDASLLIESSLVFILFHPRTRRIGCLIGLVFHGAIALCQHGDYSQTILSFYVLFFEEEELSALLARLRRISIPRAVASIAIALVAMRISFLQPAFSRAGAEPLRLAIALWTEWSLSFAFLASCAYVSFFLLRAIAENEISKKQTAAPAPTRFARAAIPIILLAYGFNCLGPYLGFQYNHAQAMFSSLSIHADNHLFLPKLELFGNDDYIEDLRVDWTYQPTPAFLAEHPDLKAILSHRGRILSNEVRSLLAHACDSELKPRAVSMRVADGRALVQFDPCAPRVRYHRFNGYDWFLPPR